MLKFCKNSRQFFSIIVLITIIMSSTFSKAEDFEYKKTYATIGLPFGSATSTSSTDPIGGFSIIAKNAQLTEKRIGDWEGGGQVLYAFKQYTPQHLSIYLGHGIAFNNRFSAGLLAGMSSNSNPQSTNINFGANIGLRIGCEIPVIDNILITPNVQGLITSLANAPSAFLALIELGYRINLPDWKK